MPVEPRAQQRDEQQVEEPVEHRLLTGASRTTSSPEEADQRGVELARAQHQGGRQGPHEPARHLSLQQVDPGEQHRLPHGAGAPRAHTLTHLLDQYPAVDGGAQLTGVDHDPRLGAGFVGDRPVLAARAHHDVAGLEAGRLLAVRTDDEVPAHDGGHRQRRLVRESHRPRCVEQDPQQEGPPRSRTVQQCRERVHHLTVDARAWIRPSQPWMVHDEGGALEA